MSVLEAIENYKDRCHPVVGDIIDITSRLHDKGCDIQFCWIPSHVGITGNEQADIASWSAATELPLTVPLCDTKRAIQHRIDNAWQESLHLQINNKQQHCVKHVIGALPVTPMRRTDVKLTRLRIGQTRFTHMHLLLGENAPECPSCKVPYSVYHILIDCSVFSHHRITFFHTSILTLSDLNRSISEMARFVNSSRATMAKVYHAWQNKTVQNQRRGKCGAPPAIDDRGE
ncbi:RNase H domain-containing protein [Trichonephila clavipes]|nr:RNase H domain-containing protein [Trichonephila clavipes]